jgi:hypothetical protein
VDSGRFEVEEPDIESGAQFKGGWTHGAGQNHQAGQMKLLLPRNGEIHRSLCPLIP